MNVQAIVVAGLVITAAGYVVWHLAHSVFGFGGSGCGDCGTSKIDKFRQTQNNGDTAPDGFVASEDVGARKD